MRQYWVVGILVTVVSILCYAGLRWVGLMPIGASAQSVSIDWLWNLELIAISFLFSLIVVPMVYSLVVFRRRKGETGDGEHIEGNTSLEIAWTIIPLVIVLVFAYLGAYSLGETRRVDPNAIVIKVKAQQFVWTFEYPEFGIISKELHLPVNQQVLLKMESSDVIHSFWVPEFRIKQDVVPGRVTEYRVTPTLLGSYKVRCSEMCGTSHAYMESPVIVNSQVEYSTWLSEQAAIAAEGAKSPEGQGQLLTIRNGCIGCHSVDGSRMAGPTWLGLYGEQVELADGSVITADDAYIAESIHDPKAKEVAGFSPTIMPPYALSETEIANIIAYMKTLK